MAMAKVGDHRGPSLAGPTCSKVNGTNISEELSQCKLRVSMKQQHAFDPATSFPFLSFCPSWFLSPFFFPIIIGKKIN